LCILEQNEVQKRRKELKERKESEENLVRIEAEKVAREWLPELAKRSKQKVTAFNRQATLKKLARQPKVIEETKRRRAAIKL